MNPIRLAGAALGWFAVLAQYWLSTTELGLVPGTINYFSFFTVLSNILVALAFTLPNSKIFSRPDVRTAIAVYIFVVGTIFFFLLRKIYHPVGLGWYVNILLHYTMPPLYILDWALFVPKRTLRYKTIPYWLIYPVVYCAWLLAHGAASGFYPYPFLNAAELGYPRTVVNILALGAFFAGLSAIFITLGRYLPAGD
jgi:hypothetical protein